MVGTFEVNIGEDNSEQSSILEEDAAEKEPTGHTLKSHMTITLESGSELAEKEGPVSTKRKAFLCSQCDSSFKTKRGLETHTRWSHKAFPSGAVLVGWRSQVVDQMPDRGFIICLSR